MVRQTAEPRVRCCRVRILDVRGGKVLGVATDDLDIEYVHIHALERRGAGMKIATVRDDGDWNVPSGDA